jgi:flagellar protein FliL
MATDVSTAPDAVAGAKNGKPKAKKSKKKLIIIVVAVLVIAGGAYKFVLAPKPKPGPPSGGEIVKLDPTTLNLAGGHYLKLAVDIQLTKGAATAADFQASQAEQLIIDEFSNRTATSLSTNATRQKLIAELGTQIKKAYPKEVYTIFLTQFVSQ